MRRQMLHWIIITGLILDSAVAWKFAPSWESSWAPGIISVSPIFINYQTPMVLRKHRRPLYPQPVISILKITSFKYMLVTGSKRPTPNAQRVTRFEPFSKGKF